MAAGTGAAARAADVAIESARAGVGSRVFFKTETVKLQEVFFDAGSVAAGHAHAEDQVAYIVSGRFEVTLDGEPHELAAGDAYLIPGGVVHGVKGTRNRLLCPFQRAQHWAATVRAGQRAPGRSWPLARSRRPLARLTLGPGETYSASPERDSGEPTRRGPRR